MTPLELRQTLSWAIRDLRGAARSFYIVLLCLIIGLAAITAVHVTAHSILGSIQANSRTILGGDWIIRQLYTPVDAAVQNWLSERGATFAHTVELRPMLVNAQSGESTLIELKAVDEAYPLFGKMLIASAKPFHEVLATGLILDRTLADRLGLKLGDTVNLGTATFTVADWIAEEPDRAGSGRFGLAPRVFISRAHLKTTGLEAPGSMIYHDLRLRWPDGAAPTKESFEAAFPKATWRLTTHENASPQIQRFVNNLLQFMTLVGLSALLIGGIGIANGLRAYFDSRLTSIAIYKMVGVPAPMLRAIYVWQITLLIGLGTLIGLGIGLVIPLAALPAIAPLLPFDVELNLAPETLATPALFGILTSALFALWPLGQAEQASPLLLFRQGRHGDLPRPRPDILAYMIFAALSLSIIIFTTATDRTFAASFIGGAFFCFAAFFGFGRLVAHLASKASTQTRLMTRLALTNLGGVGNATTLTLISLGIGLTVLVSVTLIDRNLRGILTENMPVDAPAFFFLDIQPDQKASFETFLKQWPQASNVVMTPNLRGRIKAVNGIDAETALIDRRESWLLQNDRGFTYTPTQPAHSTVTAGTWWPENYSGEPLVSVVDDVERGFGVKPGDKITVSILGRDITATIANVREVNWTSFTINFAITFAPGTLEGAPHTWLATVVAPPDQEAALQKAIAKSFPNISMVRVSEAVKSVQDILGQMVLAIRIMAVLALTTGLFVLAGTLSATRLQRVYDSVILKVIGVPQRQLTWGLVLEFLVLGIIAATLATVLGLIISWGIMDPLMDLGWTFYPALSAGVVASGALVILAVGILTLHRVLRSPVFHYLRNE